MELLAPVMGLLAAGLLSGVIAGLLGVGGGIVLVPVLFQTFILFDAPPEIRMHLAVGTSLSVICLTGWQSFRAHARAGAVDYGILRRWGASVAAGALAGAVAARFISAAGLIFVFASLSLILGLRMAFRAEAAPRAGLTQGRQKFLSGLIGFFSALMGIGGGTFSVPLLMAAGRDMHRAVATSAAIGIIVAVPATLGFIAAGWGAAGLPDFSLGFVNAAAFLAMSPAAMLGAPLGARLAHRLARRTLEYIFVAFLLLSAARMFAALLP